MRQSVLILALAFVLIQTYVLYASTFHVFHDSMPMCPVCVAVKSYGASVVDSGTSVLTAWKFDFVKQFFPPQSVPSLKTFYHSRAPPVISQ